MKILFSGAAIALIVAASTSAQVMPEILPGVMGGAGTVGVTDFYIDGVQVTGPIENVSILLEDILAGDIDADVTEAQFGLLDISDPDNAGGQGVVPGAAHSFPGGAAGADDQDFISVFKGAFRVDEPGMYTIQARTDDGFAFRVNEAEFTSVHGGGTLDADDTSTMYFGANTGDSNTRGIIDLAAGVYTFDAFMWERGGGAYAEITTAKGAYPDGGANWLVLGDNRTVEDRTVGPIAKLTQPLFVGNLDARLGGTLEEERSNLLDLQNDLDATDDTIEAFLIDDHNLATTGCPFGDFNAFRAAAGDDVAVFPNTDGSDLNEFSTLILGKFSLDDGDGIAGEELEVTFHVDSDDAVALRIVGQSFSDVAGDRSLDLDGDIAIYDDRGVCNINVSGAITLTEGVEYDLEATHLEFGGDAGIQVLVGPGNQVANGLDVGSLYVLGMSDEPIFIPGNIGLALVDPAGGDPCDFDGSGSLDVGDIDALSAAIRSGANAAQFDISGDGQVNFLDLKALVEGASKLNTYIGDANLDGEFNSGDLVSVFTAGQYEDGVGGNSTWSSGDWDADGDFTSSDFVAAFSGGGYENGPRGAVAAAVPEPSSLMLLIVGALAVVRRRR